MSLLVVEIVLALVALRRGWRVAPVLLMALCAATFVFQPTGVAAALGHALALVGLGVACWAEPAERPTSARAAGRRALHRTGPLYQI